MPQSNSQLGCTLSALIIGALIQKGVAYDPPDKIVALAINIANAILKSYK